MTVGEEVPVGSLQATLWRGVAPGATRTSLIALHCPGLLHTVPPSSPLLLPLPLVLSPVLLSFVLVSLFAGSIVLHVLRELSQGLGLELRVHLTRGKAF